MSALFGNKLLMMALLPAFLLAHLLCVCGGAVASPIRAESAHRPMTHTHECCAAHSSETHPDRSPAHDHKHDSNCPHCGVSSIMTKPDPATAVPNAHHISFLSLVPLYFDHLNSDASIRFQSISRWLSDPSPPPNLLRVKCSMQI